MRFLSFTLLLLLSVSVVSQDVPPPPVPTPAVEMNQSTVRGRVFYAESSRPVKRSSIMLISADVTNGPGEFGSLTDNEGNFEIRKVKAGTYYAVVNAPGVVSPLAFADFSKLRGGSEREAFAEAFKGFEPIVVNGVNDTYVQVPAIRGGAISGRVSYDDGDNAVGVRVEILRKVGDKYLAVIPNFSAVASMLGGGAGFQTDDRGVYRFSGLPPGEYVVRATESANHSSTDRSRYGSIESTLFGTSSFLTVFFPDALDPKSAQTIKIELGIEMTEINLTIPSRNLYRLAGKVVSKKDKTPVRANVSLKRVDDENTFSFFSEVQRRGQGVRTDADGVFEFKELPKGRYKIVIEPMQTDVYYSDGSGVYDAVTNTAVRRGPEAESKPKLAKKVEEVVIEDQDLNELSFEVGFGATISGTVAVENLPNEMPRSVTITATNELELNATANVNNFVYEGMPANRKLDRDFRIEGAVEGKTMLVVLINDEEHYVKSATAGAVDLLAGEYELKEGEVLQNVRIILGKGTGSVKGIVVDDEKEPVKAQALLFVPADVSKRRNGSRFRTATTDQAGAFETKLPPGDWLVVFRDETKAALPMSEYWAWLDAEAAKSQKITIRAGQTETVSLTKK